MVEVASGTAGREGDLSMANPIELREARARVLALTEPSLDHQIVPLAAALERSCERQLCDAFRRVGEQFQCVCRVGLLFALEDLGRRF